MSIGVKIKGEKALFKKFEKLERAGQYKILKPAVGAGGEIVDDDAKSRIDSRTGELAKSIEVKVRKLKDGAEASIGTDKYYAGWVEKGHGIVRGKKSFGHVSGRPFLTPALDSRQGKVVDVIGAIIKQAIMKVAG